MNAGPVASNNSGDPEVLNKIGRGRPRRSRWIVRVMLIALACAALAGLIVWRRSTSAPDETRYVTAPVQFGSLRETVTATGTLSPLDSVEVGAEVTGRVTKVTVDLNDRVALGQVLVEIDTEQLEARVEESQAQLQNALASRRNAEATTKEAEAKALRTRELHKRGLASDQDLEAADAALDRAKASSSAASAQIVVAQAGLKSAKTSLGKAIVRSPIDGIVLARSIEEGQTVTAGFQTPVLFTLARDLSQMELKVDIDEADIGKVREGQSATFVVDAYPGRSFASKVLRLSNLPKTGTTVVTYQALLSVDNGERVLRPGMTATATVVTSERKDVLSVPNAALRFQPPAEPRTAARPPMPFGAPVGMGRRMGGPGSARPAASAERAAPVDQVWTVTAGALEPVPVRVGASDGRRSEIESAQLRAGSQVVVDIAEDLE